MCGRYLPRRGAAPVKSVYPFLIALQFLTRVPVRLRHAPDEQAVAASLRYYPLVGLVIGLALAALDTLLETTPALLRAALVLAAWVAATGAMHLDGLADSTDAWIGGRGDRERTLAIMKDPYCGPMAVVALVFVLLLKFSALHGLSANDVVELACIPALARAAVPLLFVTTPYVRPGGLGTALAAQRARFVTLAPALAIAAGVLVVMGARGAVLVGIQVAVFLGARAAMRRRLGGMTGDTAGALIEISETCMLVFVGVG
ncbi:MAG: adenosylcobinamide-GDP ribazoletransferase [Sulfurifustis sp.]